jgi:hypothetical protein
MTVSGAHKFLWLVTSMAAVVTLLRAAQVVSREPTYAGHPLGYWVFVERRPYDPLSSPMDWDLDVPGKAAVRQAGTKAIPFLLKWISLDNGCRAAWAFGALGHVAEPAIPDLARMATNSDYAIEALGRIGPPAIPALSILATNRTVRRAPAFRTISVMRTNAMAAVPALIECLREEDSNIQTSEKGRLNCGI